MVKSSVIKAAEAFVKERLSKEGTGHDWWHIERVRNNAKAILKSEKADRFVVDLALLLHDVGDRKVLGTAEDDYSIAEGFLWKQGVPKATMDKVMSIIRNMSFSSSFGGKRPDESSEFHVVQDADRLDALGAIGIARLFAFGGSRQRPLFDPSRKAQKFSTKAEYHKMASSSYHHFEEKILLLKDLINTKAAKKIAKGRHEYIVKYMERFMLEWEGKR